MRDDTGEQESGHNDLRGEEDEQAGPQELQRLRAVDVINGAWVVEFPAAKKELYD